MPLKFKPTMPSSITSDKSVKKDIEAIKQGLEETFTEIGKQFKALKDNKIIAYFLSLSDIEQEDLLKKIKNEK